MQTGRPIKTAAVGVSFWPVTITSKLALTEPPFPSETEPVAEEYFIYPGTSGYPITETYDFLILPLRYIGVSTVEAICERNCHHIGTKRV